MKIMLAETITKENEPIYCNKCGKVLDEWDLQQDFSVYKKVTYGSAHDMETLHICLCNDCMDELIASCVVDPIIK